MKQEWYPILPKNQMLAVMRKQGILQWLDPYKVPQEAIQALELDILEFVNRSCRAYAIKKK